MFRFIPALEEFVSYQMPTRVTYMREVVFTKQGHVCSTNANLPAYAIEGGRGQVICIDPDKNKQEK